MPAATTTAAASASVVRVMASSRRPAVRSSLPTALLRHNGAVASLVFPMRHDNATSSSPSGGSSRRSFSATTSSSSLAGGGNHVFRLGSSIGTDSSMIAANHTQKGAVGFDKYESSIQSGHPSSFIGRRQLSSTSTASTSMDDEYGEMTTEGHTFTYPEPFKLESGEVLPRAEVRYMTYGTLNEARDNVLVICHALTGNASLHSWWGDLLGPGQTFDTSRYFVVCANILGSCYGSTGPASPLMEAAGDDENASVGDDDYVSKEVYSVDFPDVSVQDTVRLQLHMLQDELKISSVKCVIGGSFGGMQAVEYAAQAGSIKSPFAVDDDEGRAVPFVRSVVPIACGARHTAWQIAISEVQRQAIYADPKWNQGNPSWDDLPWAGLSVARQIGMVSYRTAKGYDKKFGRDLKEEVTPPYGSDARWEVKGYLEYQGYKFLSRFDPVTYLKLTEQMDSHDVGRNRGGAKEALSSVHIPALVLGIDSDVLYPLHEQDELASLLTNGELKVIKSDAGHDGFLLEQTQVADYISEFLSSHY
eukprot:CAMPEP_0181027332 /NCGR_PEP_ID=MMETSP1070-20121207/4110_1 /TAXON_ID=265543 /ORGANISM="Minutocellus polymorphus, Strain NH13" /LENGTH=531 /DNA_ID=CAMNT_0023104571 /DNA_START=87 /DNA_END=1682 /DNA_ORIENTATION=+